MPLYDFQCLCCLDIFEGYSTIKDRKEVVCKHCGCDTEILITNSHNQHWFKPHWNEHFTGDPVYVKSLGHYKQLCKDNNVTSRATGDVRNITEI